MIGQQLDLYAVRAIEARVFLTKYTVWPHMSRDTVWYYTLRNSASTDE